MRRSARSINVCERTDGLWGLPPELMCRVQRGKTWYSGSVGVYCRRTRVKMEILDSGDRIQELGNHPARTRLEDAKALEDDLWRDPRVAEIRVRIRIQERQLRRWPLEPGLIFSGAEEMRRAGDDPTNVADLAPLRVFLAREVGEEAENAVIKLRQLRGVDLKQALWKTEAALSAEKKALLRRLRSGDLKEKFDRVDAQMKEVESELKELERQLEPARDEQTVRERVQANEEATNQLNAAMRTRAAAQMEYDAAKNAEERLSGSNAQAPQAGNQAEDANDKVRMLEQQLEAVFQGPLRAVASQAMEAMLESTTQSECNEGISRAETDYQLVKALVQAYAACLTPGLQQQILQVRNRARNVKAQCNSMAADTRRGDAGGGFESTGETTDVASETRTASVSADRGNANVRSVEAAINRCDFDRALASLNEYRPADPNDPWMASKYQEVHEQRERVAEVKRLLSEVRGILANNPSPNSLRYAVDLMRAARSVAPNCMSGSISALGPVIDGAAAAARQADRERSREAVAGLAETLITVQDAIDKRRRGGPDVASGLPPFGGVGDSNRGSGGGGFESSRGGTPGVTAAGGGRAPPPPNPAPPQPASPGASTGCAWTRPGGVLGQDAGTFSDSAAEALGEGVAKCYCTGRLAPDSRCAGPRPR